MATVRFTPALKRFIPDLETQEVPGETVREIIDELEILYPGFRGYILEDHGGLRTHVNIFIDSTVIEDRKELSDAVRSNDEIHILQALSGGKTTA